MTSPPGDETVGPEGAESSRSHWPRVIPWLAALIPFLLACLWQLRQGYGLTAGDYAHYLLHARALLEGQPYADTGYLFTAYNPFLAPPVQPPGLPVTLAAVFSLVGWNVTAARFVVVGMALGYLFAAGRYFHKRESRALGFGVVLLAGLSPQVVHGSTQVLADLPFAAAIWITILIVDDERPWTAGRIAAVAALGLFAMSFRAAGVAIVPALGLFALLNLRRLGWRPLAPVALWMGVAVLAFFGFLPGTSGLSGQVSNSMLSGLAFELKRFVAYRLPIFESMLYPFPSDLLNDLYHLAAAPVLLVGLVEWGRRSWRTFLASFSIVYAVMLLVVDVVAGRYAWPLFPLFVFGLLNGARVVVASVRRAWSRSRCDHVVLGAAAIVALMTLGRLVLEPPPPNRAGILADEPDVVSLFAELERLDTDRAVRIVFVKPRVATLETRIPAMGLFRASDADTMAELCAQRISHVVAGDYGMEPALNGSITRVIDAHPTRFDLLYDNSSFSLYRLVAPCEDGADAGGMPGDSP